MTSYRSLLFIASVKNDKASTHIVFPVYQVEKSVPMLTVGLPAVSGANQAADITEEPNPLELSKEALARRPSFRYAYVYEILFQSYECKITLMCGMLYKSP